ncbi:hypothetical protein MANES_17G020166v8 [Manihot esculenta]|uniref:Uncharacterized protein n=1 Tax=Manihot esculenta TaxID=3983 RepID=A0ACB7G1T0_MANES|nr:hypothetical protein MANES_17G020166v8 [Manihot esculenta]
MSPFEALYGFCPNPFPILSFGATSMGKVEEFLVHRTWQHRMKQQQADKHRSERELVVGYWVYLRLQSYRQATAAMRHSLKLSTKIYGPFKVIEKIGTIAYKLQLPAHATIHPVFHDLPEMQEDTFTVLPGRVLETRTVTRREQQVVQGLIKWLNLLEDDATWEDQSFITAQFPQFSHSWRQKRANGSGIFVILLDESIKGSRKGVCYQSRI